MVNPVIFQKLQENIINIGEELKGKNREEIVEYITSENEKNKGIYTTYKKLVFKYTDRLRDAVKEGYINDNEVRKFSKMLFNKYNYLYRRVAEDIEYFTRDVYTEDKVMGAYYVIQMILSKDYNEEDGLPIKEKIDRFNVKISTGIKSDDDKMNVYIGEIIEESINHSFRAMEKYLKVNNLPFSKELCDDLAKLYKKVKKENAKNVIAKILDENDKKLCEKIINEFDDFYEAIN